MELFLLQLAAFLRPIFFISIGVENLFDIAALVISTFLCVAFFANAALRRNMRISEIDFAILVFSVYCVAVSLIYFDKVYWREVPKLLIPLWTYVVAKNVIRSEAAYCGLLRIMIIGFIVPVVMSAVIIIAGGGVENLDYYTGIPRWRGIYDGSHSMAHNVTFLLFLMTTFVVVRRITTSARTDTKKTDSPLLLWIFALVAIYCLYQSQVRTGIVGLAAFLIIVLFNYNKKALVILVVLTSIGVIATLPVLMPRFAPDVLRVEKGYEGEEGLGSGRPQIWSNNVDIFMDLPLDRQLAGAGIGNKNAYGGTEGITDSHNDWLDVLMQTGFVGFGIYAVLQLLFLRKILALTGKEKYVFLAVFVAVAIMNLVSSSYVNRYGLAQMYYMLMSFVEINRQRQVGSAADESGANDKRGR
jgi:O-antigen ligase